MYDHVVDERMGYTEMGGLGFDLYSFSWPAFIIIAGLYHYLIMLLLHERAGLGKIKAVLGVI